MQHNHCRAGGEPSANTLRDQLGQNKKGGFQPQQRSTKRQTKRQSVKGKNLSCNAATAVMHCRLTSCHGGHLHPHPKDILKSCASTDLDCTALPWGAILHSPDQPAQKCYSVSTTPHCWLACCCHSRLLRRDLINSSETLFSRCNIAASVSSNNCKASS